MRAPLILRLLMVQPWFWPLIVVTAILACSCGPGLAPGYRTLTLGARIGEKAQENLTATCKARRLACEAKHPVGDLRTACELSCLKALRVWDKAKAAYNAAATTTWGALEVARVARSEAKWTEAIRPGLCALAGALAELRGLIGGEVAAWLTSLAAVKEVGCD